MKDITAIGEILIDLTQSDVSAQGIPIFSANPGGAPANLAVAAAKLGASTAFIGKVGDDSFGRQLQNCLSTNGVDVSGLCVDTNEKTTLAVVSVSPDGERSFSFYRDPSADVNLRITDLDEKMLCNTRFLHFGSVSLTSSPAAETTVYAVKRAKENGALISYDPNYRANLWDSENEALIKMKAPLNMVDILKVSDEELLLLTGSSDLEEGTRILSTYGITLILVTLGAAGAFYRYNDMTGHVAGISCKVGDTNGAGDTFFGAFLSRLSYKSSLAGISRAELEDMILFANKAASITTSRHGAIPAMPSLSEII